ncbi:uncharacterized protein LOC125463318 isoform X2 [Stegostoma tigrinum]|uniref:uncharacterized protein LOC125463318 isoform X2 n=1 Tax=Stegostoma tigrinum TaxID=3053191 RepID=UPI00202ADDC1|nr:uncharacterized protein LOC125463318 isoform X2 [Stegostoma tigrinum]
MMHRETDKSNVVKRFSTLSKPSNLENTVDSSPWDSEEEGLSKDKDINEEKRPCCSVNLSSHQILKSQPLSKDSVPPYKDLKETLKDAEPPDKHLSLASKSKVKNRYDVSLQVPYQFSTSNKKTALLNQVTHPSYSGWSDSSSETQPIFSIYEGVNNNDNQKKNDEGRRDSREEQKKKKGRSKETLKKNLHSVSIHHQSSQTSSHMQDQQNSVSNQLLVEEWEKERKAKDKTQSEREEYVTELGQTSPGFTEESNNPTNVGVTSEENIIVRILKDVAGYKDSRQVYHFDFGHQYFYETRKEHTENCINNLADWSDDAIRQCWRNLFAVVRILVNLFSLFLIELLNFLCRSVFQVLLVGLLTVIGDHLLKPFLAALFNSLLQPIMIFLLNVFIGIRNLLNPSIDILRRLLMQIAAVLHAFRLVEVNLNRTPSQYQDV